MEHHSIRPPKRRAGAAQPRLMDVIAGLLLLAVAALLVGIAVLAATG